MKKLLLFAAAVLAAKLAGWLPAAQTDVGQLLPVETLVLSLEDGRLALTGGEDLCGRGLTWETAMEDLAAAAPGKAFFGCTGQVVLTGETAALLPDVLRDRRLRPAAQVCVADGEVEPAGAGAFLRAHEPGVTLQQLQAAALEGRTLPLPRLVCEDGRYRLEHG